MAAFLADDIKLSVSNLERLACPAERREDATQS
jgi:hypothetical protein